MKVEFTILFMCCIAIFFFFWKLNSECWIQFYACLRWNHFLAAWNHFLIKFKNANHFLAAWIHFLIKFKNAMAEKCTHHLCTDNNLWRHTISQCLPLNASCTVRVLFGHSFAVATPKPIVIRGSRFLTIGFGTSAPKRKAEVKFHYPFWFPNRKAEVGVHYSFWNFCFQFQKPHRFFTIRFGTFAPKTKGGAVGVELPFWNMNGRAKSISHYPFWNRCSKWITPKQNSTILLFIQIETWIPNKKEWRP